jgi:hypothetical protein
MLHIIKIYFDLRPYHLSDFIEIFVTSVHFGAKPMIKGSGAGVLKCGSCVRE